MSVLKRWLLGLWLLLVFATFSLFLIRNDSEDLAWRVLSNSNLLRGSLTDVWGSEDGQALWVVGRSGLLASSVDGGKTWRRSEIATKADLFVIRFSDARTGYAAGADGVVLHTSDGGGTWKRLVFDSSINSANIWFRDIHIGDRVYLLGRSDMEYSYGRTWTFELGPEELSPKLVDSVPEDFGSLTTVPGQGLLRAGRSGYAVGKAAVKQFGDPNNQKLCYVGYDEGNASPWVSTPTSFYSALKNQDWTTETWDVGMAPKADGVLPSGYAVRGAGRLWGHSFNTIRRINQTTYLGVGEDWIARSTDGGKNWQTLASGPSQCVRIPGSTTLYLGWGPELYRSTDLARTWKLVGVYSDPITELVVKNNSLHVVMGDGQPGKDTGLVTATEPVGRETPSPPEQAVGTANVLVERGEHSEFILRWLNPASKNPQQSMTSGGYIRLFRSSGSTYASFGDRVEKIDSSGQSTPVPALQELLYLDSQLKVSLGIDHSGKLVRGTEALRGWRSLSTAWAPPTWYWVLIIGVVGAYFLTLRRHGRLPAVAESIVEKVVSDRPLAPMDPDALGTRTLAEGLSRYIRNENTQPPLNIAITGEWGSGKSSLLNLLTDDLQKHRYRPICFNAWHHQQEDTLLAFLLQAIEQQLTPPTYQGGTYFRALLILRRALPRIASVLVTVLLSLVILLPAFGLFCALTGQEPLQLGSEAINATIKSLRNLSAWHKKVTEALSLLAGTLLAKWLHDLGNIFSISPGMLGPSSDAKSLNLKVSARHIFAKEFEEATSLLGGRVVLIVDDLDRCRPETVAMLMEAINYLSCSGKCFIVLAMAREPVERALALAYRDIAAESVEQDGDARAQRLNYARNFMEKLVNLEIAAPVASDLSAYIRLVSPADQTQRAAVARYEERKRGVGYILAALLVLALLTQLNQWLPEAEDPKTPVAVATTTPNQAADPEPSPSPVRTVATRPQDRDIGPYSRPYPVVVKNQTAVGSTTRTTWLFWCFTLVPVSGVVFYLNSRPKRDEVDSKEFSEALELWGPLLAPHFRTLAH